MRQSCLVLTALLCATVPAWAQVTVNLQALEPLAKHTAKKPPPASHSAARTTHHRVASGKKRGKPPAQSPEQPTPAPPPATVATAPPAAPAPTATKPAPPPAPEPSPAPSPPPISNTASSAATQTSGGLRVTFGAGQADLSPASAAAIKGVIASAPPGDGTTFNVVAYAAGAPEDPSTARRLSLSRALAVRSVLMADGISSSRIYVRALGATGGDEVPDRVDLAVMGSNAPGLAPASTPAPNTSTKSQSQ